MSVGEAGSHLLIAEFNLTSKSDFEMVQSGGKRAVIDKIACHSSTRQTITIAAWFEAPRQQCAGSGLFSLRLLGP